MVVLFSWIIVLLQFASEDAVAGLAWFRLFRIVRLFRFVRSLAPKKWRASVR